MAKIFGDTDIAVYSDDIHVDHNTHELVVEAHDGSHVQRVATEAGVPDGTTPKRGSIEDAKRAAHHHETEAEETRAVRDERVGEKV